MFAVGDMVQVVRTVTHHQYKGRVGVVVKFYPDALASDGTFYHGWSLSPTMLNKCGKNIAWRADQIKKIDPPDWQPKAWRKEEEMT